VTGEDLKAARLRAGLSQQEVAARVDVTQPTISNWESGSTTIPHDDRIRLREFLDISLGEVAESAHEEPSPFGAWVGRTRAEKQLTVAELAGRAGISTMQVYNIESGRTANPRETTRLKLARALDQDPPPDAILATEAAVAIEGVGSLEDFDPYADDQLPDEGGVYVFYDISERPIYVGESASVRDRIRSHRDKFWFKQPIVQTAAFVRVLDEETRKSIEQVLIRFLKSNAVINKHYVQRGGD